jgi:hypothetical protein
VIHLHWIFSSNALPYSEQNHIDLHEHYQLHKETCSFAERKIITLNNQYINISKRMWQVTLKYRAF